MFWQEVIYNLTEHIDMILKNYYDCLDATECPESSSSCQLGEYENYPADATNLKENLTNAFHERGIQEVRLESWLQTDRCTLNTLAMDTDEFLDDFCERLLKLKARHFVLKELSFFFKNLKENILPGELLICFDLSENYAFVIPNVAQPFHCLS